MFGLALLPALWGVWLLVALLRFAVRHPRATLVVFGVWCVTTAVIGATVA